MSIIPTAKGEEGATVEPGFILGNVLTGGLTPKNQSSSQVSFTEALVISLFDLFLRSGITEK